MTLGEGSPRRDGRESKASRPQRAMSEASSRGENRLLVSLLVLLVIVLIGMIAYLARNNDAAPADPNPGTVPTPLFSIPGPGSGDAPVFVRPLSAAWGPEGDIYVSDTGNGRICVFSEAGKFRREFGRLGSSKTANSSAVLQQPAGISVGADGEVYVADVRAGEVVVFDSKGTLIRRIHPQASDRAKNDRWTPTDVVVSRGLIYVTDVKGVAVFSAGGVLQGRTDRAGSLAFAYPNGVSLRRDGTLVVSDTNNRRVVSVAGTSSLVWSSGPSDAAGRVIGLPRGLSVAADGSTLVADAFLFGIIRLSSTGEFVERYGERGSELGRFEFPNDVDARGDLVVVADKENNRVQVIQWPALLVTPSK